jgi:DNA primase
MIEREKIEQIKRETDIVALISQYVPLKKIGRNYRALCPFHSEKNPSFYVNPEKKIYYCFGCRKGGSAINFLMEYEKLDFPDAVRRLAKNLGIDIDTTKGLKYKDIYDANELACQFYSMVLTKEMGKRGQNYVKARNIDLNTLRDFRLGYAPASGGLVTFMRQKGVAVDKLGKAGLISQSHEIFRDRLIFPIFNVSGRIIGFGGRGIDDYMQPKYLNSPETPIFRKGEILYGLYQSRESIRQKGEAILVEGYFDLLSLVQKGILNVCAPLGTSLTEKQSLLISRYAKRVNILFDGDLSGIKAALRSIGLLINTQVEVFVTSLPEGTDPDTFVNQQGVEQLRKLIDGASDFFHFYRRAVKTTTVEQEVALIKDLIQIIGTIQDPIKYDRYLKYSAHVFDMPIERIERAMTQKTTPQAVPRKTSLSTEERLMAMILNAREYFPLAKKVLKPEDFKQEHIARLYKVLLKRENFDVYDLSDVIDEQLREKLLSIIIKEEPVSEDAYVESLGRFKNRVEEKRIRQKIIEARKSGDEQALRACQTELDSLKKKMLKITSLSSEKNDIT